MPVEYTCNECGKRTTSYAMNEPPKHRLCLVCSFLQTIPDPAERAEMRERLRASIKLD